LVVKQSREGEDDPAGARHEAAVLERLRAADRGLATLLPVVLAYDPAAGVLVLEAARDARDVRERHAGGRFSRELAATTGRALALLHRVRPDALDNHPAPWSSRSSLQLHRPKLQAAREMTSAAIALIRAVQRSAELCGALDELRAAPYDPALIHGDLRWDNVLTARTPRSASTRRSRVLLLDWESAGRGDPSLDLGAWFGEYLYAWVCSIPFVDPDDPGRLVADARLPLARMRPALNAFWQSYARHGASDERELARVLRRAARHAAVRVLTCAYEESMSRDELAGSARFALRLSLNVLQRPDEALAHLLGIGASWAR
jgi:aminoglycoside phosphotransferase (APT) family kinase protein